MRGLGAWEPSAVPAVEVALPCLAYSARKESVCTPDAPSQVSSVTITPTGRVERFERLGVDRQLHNETPQDWGQEDTHVGGGVQGNGVDHTVTEVLIDTLHPLESLLQAHRFLWKPFSSAEG